MRCYSQYYGYLWYYIRKTLREDADQNHAPSLKDVRLEWGRRCNMPTSSNRNLLHLVNIGLIGLLGKTLAKTG